MLCSRRQCLENEKAPYYAASDIKEGKGAPSALGRKKEARSAERASFVLEKGLF